MSWRPEGWGNPYTVNPQLKDYPKNAFEQGADAMLEAITEETEKVENPYYTTDPSNPITGLVNVGSGGFEECRQKILALLK